MNKHIKKTNKKQQVTKKKVNVNSLISCENRMLAGSRGINWYNFMN